MEDIRKKALLKLNDYITSNIDKVDIPIEYISLCGLGGRVCYSKYPDIKDDKRLNDLDELIKYLDRLSRWSHYSIFSHLPVLVYVSIDDFIKYELYNLFKSYYNKDDEILYLNFRHIIESFYVKDKNKGIFSNVIQSLKLDRLYKLFIPLREIVYNPVYKTKIVKSELDDEKEIVIGINALNNSKYKWISFLLLDVDRVLTHQLIRHQTLNFNQQSHRYVKLSKTKSILPESVKLSFYYNKRELHDIEPLFDKSLTDYNKLLSKNYPAEEARFILPQATITNIIVTGYSNDIEKYLHDRLSKQAQSNIRIISKYMKDSIAYD